MESRAGFLRLKEEQKLEREMNGYMDWICRAGKQKKLLTTAMHTGLERKTQRLLNMNFHDRKFSW